MAVGFNVQEVSVQYHKKVAELNAAHDTVTAAIDELTQRKDSEAKDMIKVNSASADRY